MSSGHDGEARFQQAYGINLTVVVLREPSGAFWAPGCADLHHPTRVRNCSYERPVSKTPDEINNMASSRYQELIGSLQCASLVPRPDITLTLKNTPTPWRRLLDAALRVLRYLKGTKYRSFHLGRGIPNIASFLDSDLGRRLPRSQVHSASGIGNVPDGEGGLLAQRSFEGPWC